MPGLIRRSDIDEVRSRTNIADIVGDFVTLKSAGVGSLKGLCPFHEERSPSFHVRPQVGLYHCFGCNEGGDVFSFLQKMDHVTFAEAVERLAGRLGYELHYEDGGQASDHGNRARLLAANAAAEKFFQTQLATPAAQIGRDFLGARGFDAAAAQHFGIGFAPKSFNALGDALKKQGFTPEELTASGLLSTGDRGNAYDRFRGRLIWPIRDVTGQTVGFGARKVLGDDEDKGPKYLNTPETAVYHKSQVLYGLDLARRDIAKGKQVVVVEGYTDVMACHLAGVTTAVATCGTSFGVDHIKVIRRVLGDVDNSDTAGTGEVVFTFDPDEAGQKAASRAFQEEQRFAAQTFVAVAPDNLDPSDLRTQRGDEAVRRLIADRKPMFEFMIRRVLARYDLETVEGRVGALRAAAPVVAGIRDRSLSDGYVRNLAGWLGMDPAEVGRMVRSAKAARPTTSAPVAEPDAERAPPDVRLLDLPTDVETRMERDALLVILQRPQAIGRDLIERAVAVRMRNSILDVVRDGVATAIEAWDRPDWIAKVAEAVPARFAGLIAQLGVAPIPETREANLDNYARAQVADLVAVDLSRRKADLQGASQRAAAEGDADRARRIQVEIAALETERRKLRAG
ncbi:MAG: DNA primase [Pseudolysinimonas sp.]|uniref:DNA primase n=1 Tax=Pseudolysinimonas sp. TaxID=2680009 RepID=UPI003C764F9E